MKLPHLLLHSQKPSSHGPQLFWPRRSRGFWLAFLLTVLFCGAGVTSLAYRQAQAAVAEWALQISCDVVAADEASLDQAIRCVNSAGPGLYTIQVTADITLTQPLPALNNEQASQVVLEGNGYAINAQGQGRILSITTTQVTVRNLTLRGGRSLTDDWFAAGGAIQLYGGRGDGGCGLTLSGSTLEDNQAFAGGAIANLCDDSVITITNSLLHHNQATRGGAIFIPTGEELFSELIIDQSQLTDNQATERGGAILLSAGDAGSNATISNSTIANNRVISGTGGGLSVVTNDEAAITNALLRNVAIISNTATSGGGLEVASRGATNVTVANTTISGNTADGLGGGIWMQGALEFDSTNVRLINSTVASNTAPAAGGIAKLDGLITLTNTLVAGNTNGDCQWHASPGLPNRVVSGGHNLDSDGTCLPEGVRQPSDLPNGTANLGPLADNGGATFTHALLAGSQALDAGDDAVCASEPVAGIDQRGVTRPQGDHCDIGAYEAAAQPVATNLLFVSSRSSATAGGVPFRDEDILAYDFNTNTWQMIFDGSDVGITKDVDAFAFRPNGTLLLSFNGPTVVPGLGAVDDSDIVLFTPTQLGGDTAGSFAWFLHGAAVGLTTDGEDIDAIGITAAGKIVVSTIGDFSTPTLAGQDEDLIQLDDPASGTWSLFLDGSAVGLANEDVNGFWLDIATGERYLTVKDSFAFADGQATVQIDSDDIFVCTPTQAGDCTYRRFWDSDAHDYSAENLDSIGLGTLPASFSASGQGQDDLSSTLDEAAVDDDIDDFNVEELINQQFVPWVARGQ